MPVNRIWVIAESFEGKPLTITLELLTAARSLGSTVEAVVWGADGDSVAAQLGAYGATEVYNVADIGEQLHGVADGAALHEAIQGGYGPDAVVIPTTDG